MRVFSILNLTQVLHKTSAENGQSSTQLASTTSRQLYGLFEWDVLESKIFWQDSCGQWLQCYSFNYPHFSLNVRLVKIMHSICVIQQIIKCYDYSCRFLINQFSIDELTGFNNTGNVCKYKV